MGIVDRRELEFNSRALVSVVAASLDQAHAIGLPPRKPTGVEFDTRGFRIKFSYSSGSAVDVSASRLGALLISYCIRARIPLPRLPDKEIRVTANAVIIVFQTQYGEPPSV